MIILACETSTLLGSVALTKDGVLLSYKESFRQGSHSEVLNVFIEQVLTEANLTLEDVDLFATGVGPGSFTGIRISLNTIKTFSYSCAKPCVGINSLTNLAQQFVHLEIDNKPIVTMINAYKNMVYIATYEKRNSSINQIKPPSVVRVQNLSEYITNLSYVVGDAYSSYQTYLEQHLSSKIERRTEFLDEPNAKILAELALKNASFANFRWNELLPVYLRASEAEENAQGIKYQPLF